MPEEINRKRNQELEKIEIVDENLRGGFAQVPRYVLRAKGLSPKSKLVYVALLDYAWQEGSCFPGQPRLAADLDVSIDTVQRALAELRARQLVDWTQRGLNQTNVYYILRLSDNPHWELDQEGNRKLRFPDTAKSGFKKPQKRGTKNTQKQHTQNEYTQPSNSFELLTQKNKEEPTSRFSKKRERSNQNDANGLEVEPSARPTGRGELKPIATALEVRVAELKASAAAAKDRDQPPRRGRPPKYAATPAIEALMTDWTAELHDDPEHVRSNVSQAARLWHESGVSEDTFRDLLYEARKRTKGAGNVEKLADGGAGEMGLRNRMPYMFACLKKIIREDLQRQVHDRAPSDGKGKSSRNKVARAPNVYE